MNKQDFREEVKNRLEDEGVRVQKNRLRKAVNRVYWIIHAIEGELNWKRRYIRDAVRLYKKNK